MAFQPETYTEEYINYVFLWHSLADACLKCRSLNGQEFHDQDLFQHVLWSPIWGDIFDLDLGLPLTHGGPGNNCRCQCEVLAHVNLRQINELDEFLGFMEMLHI